MVVNEVCEFKRMFMNQLGHRIPGWSGQKLRSEDLSVSCLVAHSAPTMLVHFGHRLVVPLGTGPVKRELSKPIFASNTVWNSFISKWMKVYRMLTIYVKTIFSHIYIYDILHSSNVVRSWLACFKAWLPIAAEPHSWSHGVVINLLLRGCLRTDIHNKMPKPKFSYLRYSLSMIKWKPFGWTLRQLGSVVTSVVTDVEFLR